MNLDKNEILKLVADAPAGLKVKEIVQALALSQSDRSDVRRVLREMADAGLVELGAGARYYKGDGEAARDSNLLEGVLHVNPAGYGFVEQDGPEPSIFIPARYMAAALDGDRVRIAPRMGQRGTEGRIVEIVSRGRAKLTGLLKYSGKRAYLEPDDPRIQTAYGVVELEGGVCGAEEGECVVAEILRYPETGLRTVVAGELVAKVTHVLGDPDDPRTEVEKILIASHIPTEFPPEVEKAGENAPTKVRKKDMLDRVDLRDRPFLTIDPETARDFDDAVFVEPLGRGWRLWVAVADVSHYVTPRDPIDIEAQQRGVSVYLPDRAIPMLPEQLSSNICSLLPEEDRCAMVARIDLDEDAEIIGRAFMAAVINSHSRLDYPGVAAALAGDFRGTRKKYEQWLPNLELLRFVSKKLRKRRMARGSLDFDLPEAKVIVDEDDPGRVRDVKRTRSDPAEREAYQMIEDCMLAANEAVAWYFRERELDSMWRVHDVPSEEKLAVFAEFASAFGVNVTSEEVRDPKVLQAVLREVKGKPYERALSFLLLRSLKQAAYDTVNVGHFGLASSDYVHFTSPIRRYPDLIVHRLLKYHLRAEGLPAGGGEPPAPPTREKLQAMAMMSSAHERRAVEAEREVVDMYRAFLMRDRIGDELDGMITAVTGFGFFVQCDDPFVEGLVRIETLAGGPYEHEETKMRLRGAQNRMFSVGDTVKVRVENVSVPRRRIDFALVGEEAPARPGEGREQATMDFPAFVGEEVQRRYKRPSAAHRRHDKNAKAKETGTRKQKRKDRGSTKGRGGSAGKSTTRAGGKLRLKVSGSGRSTLKKKR